jgi:hypothetical protein
VESILVFQVDRRYIPGSVKQEKRIMRKRLRDLRREFPNSEIKVCGSGHYRIVLPNGRFIVASATPSCWRTERNFKAQLRKIAQTPRR